LNQPTGRQLITLASDIKIGDQLFAKRGQTIQLALAPSDVNVSEELDTFLAGYKPSNYRFDEVSPPFLVDKHRDQYRAFDVLDAFEEVEVETSVNARVRQVDPRSALSDYLVVERALGSFIPRRVEAESTYDMRERASRRISTALGLNREIRGWTVLTTAGNWATENKLTPTFLWTDLVDGNPLKDIETIVEASAQDVTGFWFNWTVMRAFLSHPTVRDHMRQMLGDLPAQQVNNGQLDFAIPGFPPFHVCQSKRRVAGVQTNILGNFVVAITSPKDGVPTNAEDIKTIQTFRKKGDSGTGFVTREFEVDERGLEGGTMLVQGHGEDVKMLADNCGGLISTVV
jgi:hypothetical protein